MINIAKNIFYYKENPLWRFFNSFSNPITPVKFYSNGHIMKKEILKDQKEKSGIYRWVNKINGKSYVGSGKDLSQRLNYYYSLTNLEKSNMVISKALLKYGYSNFSLEILEYCDIDL